MTKPTEKSHKTAEDIYEDALKLSDDEREKLSQMLAQETDTFYDTPEIKKAWEEEIARRIKLMDEGKMKMFDAEEVMREARQILAE